MFKLVYKNIINFIKRNTEIIQESQHLRLVILSPLVFNWGVKSVAPDNFSPDFHTLCHGDLRRNLVVDVLRFLKISQLKETEMTV